MKTLITLIACILAATIGRASEKDYFPQSKKLDTTVLIRMDKAWRYDQNTEYPLLRVRFTYQGGNPNDKYAIKASLQDNGMKIQNVVFWQVGVPPDAAPYSDGIPMIWEFKDFPAKAKDLTLILSFTPKTGGDALGLAFRLPSPDRLDSKTAVIE